MNKLTLIVCEGLGDKRVLQPLYPQSEYVIIYGDFITENDLLRHEVITETNILVELNKLIITSIDQLNISTKITLSDIERIIYVTDSDRCFESNVQKNKVLSKLSKCSFLKLKKQKKEFKLLIFSNNLEHLFLGETKEIFSCDKERRVYKTKVAKQIVSEFTSQGFEYTCLKLNEENVLPYSEYSDFCTNPELLVNRSTNLNVIPPV